METLLQSGRSASQLMTYGFESSQLKGLQQEVKQYNSVVKKLTTDVTTMRKELSITRSELSSVRNYVVQNLP